MNPNTNKKAQIPSLQEQEFYMGARQREPLSDTILLHERFHLKKGFSANIPQCDLLVDESSDKSIGIIPRIALAAVWDKAEFYTKNKTEKTTGISESEWKQTLHILTDFITKNKKTDAQTPVLIQDFLDLPELTFQSLFLHKAGNVIELIKTAVLGDIAETARLKKRWHRIKKYKHKVALEQENGGIFSVADANILRSYGIQCLNQIRKQNVYAIKNMLLEHSTVRLIEEINAAFKEDLARRRDKRYKRNPFIIAYFLLTALAFVGYQYKYDLIKNVNVSFIMLGLSALFTLNMLFIVYAARRAVRRRKKKRPDYYYFTAWVRAAFSAMFLLAMFSLGSTTVFYGRYDGYSSVLYYRDLDDGTVAVAGLRDDTLHHIKIPQQLDGKPVSEIDIACFRNDEFSKVTVPANVKIDKFAFIGCVNLKQVDASTALSVGMGAFKDCASLTSIALPQAIEQKELAPLMFENCTLLTDVIGIEYYTDLGAKAFANCTSLQHIGLSYELKAIGSGTFDGCQNLQSLSFNDQLQSIGATAFRDCGALTEVHIPDSVTAIGKHAFYGCANLQTVSSPFLGKSADRTEKGYLYVFDGCNAINTLTVTNTQTITSSAFKGGEHISHITLCEGLTAIESNAFKGYKNITSITFPSTVTTIGDNAFEGCSSILEIDLASSSVTTVGDYAFKDCSSLSLLTLPTTLSVIPKGIAMNCTSLSSIVINEGVSEIEKDAFNNAGLISIEIHNNISTLGEQAFYNCDKLSEIVLPDSVQFIGKRAFGDCDALTAASVPFLGRSSDDNKNGFLYVFEECPVLTSLQITNMSTIYKNTFRGGEQLIHIVLNEGLTAIEDKAFYEFPSLTSITLPSTLTSIGKSAFEGCSAIPSVDLSACALQSVGKSAFENCTALTALLLPDTLTEISAGFAQNCGNLTDVTLPAALLKINAYAFAQTIVTDVVFPDGLTFIGDSAFYNCDRLTEISLPNTVTYFGKNVFSNCSALYAATTPFLGKTPTKTRNGYNRLFNNCYILQSLTITNMTEIGSNTLTGGERLSVITLTEGLTTIGDSAFKNYRNLSVLSLPSTLTGIGNKAFEGCSALLSMDLAASSVTQIGSYAFKDCSSLMLLTLPDTLTVVPKGIAMNCISLQSIEIGPSINTIEADAFNGSSLKAIEFHDNIQAIGSKSFYNCDFLTEIVLPNSLTSIGKQAFGDCRNLTVATVPFLGKSNTSDKGGFGYVFENCPYLTTITITAMSQTSKQTFKGAQNLTSVTFSDMLTSIGNQTFLNCYNLQFILFPTTVTTIGDSAFEGCSALASFDLSVLTIEHLGKNLFKNCSNLSQITLPQTLTAIPEGFAENCSSLYEIAIPATVTEIGNNAFAHTNLTELVLPQALTHIGKKAFYDCGLLTALLIPNSVQTIGKYAFGACNGITVVEAPFLGKSLENTKNGCKHIFEYALTNIHTIEITKLTTVGRSMFAGVSNLNTLILNEGVTTIGKKAFENLGNLEVIQLPSTLRTIEKSAFKSCISLNELDLSYTTVSTIGTKAFYGCTALSRLMLPDSLTEIPAGMATSCSSLLNVRLPKHLTKIGDDAFKNCFSLATLTADSIDQATEGVAILPDSVTEIGDRAFADCHWLLSFNVGKKLEILGAYAFDNCMFLTEITLPDTLQSIGSKAFRSCRSLSSLRIPAGVEKIGYRIAADCGVLTSLEVPFIGPKATNARTLRYITDSTAITTVTVTAAEKLAARTFANCENLTMLCLNDGITKIGKNVVVGCKRLQVVVLPASMRDFAASFPQGTVIFEN